ncbi:MAG: hypothetical protein LBO62_05095 [Endomicrobium sp.]|jgi:uncharacterized protein YpmB|nr:hypothetical protein [Endomicrobium sp.]
MEPVKSKKKWVIFGGIILFLAVLIAVGPVIITRYMRAKTQAPQRTADFMIKVSGTIQQDGDSVYLKGSNGLYYVLLGEQKDALLQNLNKTVTVFGTIYEPSEGETIAENPVRFKIGVAKFDLPSLNPSGGK